MSCLRCRWAASGASGHSLSRKHHTLSTAPGEPAGEEMSHAGPSTQGPNTNPVPTSFMEAVVVPFRVSVDKDSRRETGTR